MKNKTYQADFRLAGNLYRTVRTIQAELHRHLAQGEG